MLGKLVLLRSSDELERDPVLSTLPRLVIGGMFATELTRKYVRLPPLAMGSIDNVTLNGGLISPQSPPRSQLGRLIDPSLVSLKRFSLRRTNDLTGLQPLHRRT
jgi:hypothetical protein